MIISVIRAKQKMVTLLLKMKERLEWKIEKGTNRNNVI
jgi:hypothetical protein